MPVGIMEEIRPHLLVNRWARYISVKSSSQIIKQNNDWKLLFSRVNNQIIGSVEQGWLTSILQPVFLPISWVLTVPGALGENSTPVVNQAKHAPHLLKSLSI